MMERLTTGSPELDGILGGGLPKDTITLLSGSPGTGKTVLALQMLFANAGPGSKGLYLTTLSEPYYKLTRFMQSLSFFDEEKLLGEIAVHDLGADIAGNGLAALPKILAELIKQVSPRFIVIDSFKALHDLAASEDVFRGILYEMAALFTGYACSTLLLGEYSLDAPEHEPEFAVVDGILEMVNKKLGVRDERYLRVIKLRGSTYASGEHAFRITQDGIMVFPRLVPGAGSSAGRAEDQCVSTGLPVLDRILSGGLPRGSTTLVSGLSGAGKTTLGMTFAGAGAAAGEDSLYVTFQERPASLRASAGGLSLDLGRTDFLYCSPVEMNIDEVVWRMLKQLDAKPVRRLVLDALGDLEAACWDKVRFRHYLYALGQLALDRRVSLLMIMELPRLLRHDTFVEQDTSCLADNVIVLGQVDSNTSRTIQVLKRRGGQHNLPAYGFAIEQGKGIVVEKA